LDILVGVFPGCPCAATTHAERQTLQNAVTDTHQQIDALVYKRYGLTEEEIALVEGTG
jgi:phage gp36-like protein